VQLLLQLSSLLPPLKVLPLLEDPSDGRTDGRGVVYSALSMYAICCCALNTDNRELLELVLRGCAAKGAKNDCVVALDHYRQPLIKECFLAVVMSRLSDVPS